MIHTGLDILIKDYSSSYDATFYNRLSYKLCSQILMNKLGEDRTEMTQKLDFYKGCRNVAQLFFFLSDGLLVNCNMILKSCKWGVSHWLKVWCYLSWLWQSKYISPHLFVCGVAGPLRRAGDTAAQCIATVTQRRQLSTNKQKCFTKCCQYCIIPQMSLCFIVE